MAEKITGFVKEIGTKNGTSKAGKAWTLYSLVVVSAEGRDLGRFGAGFNAPKSTKDVAVKSGDYVRFEVEKKGEYFNVVEGTIEISSQPPKATAPAAAAAASGTAVATQSQIQYQAARNAAIEVVKLLVAAKALPISAAATKAGEAKRYEEIAAIIDKLTVRFHHDVTDLRLLDTVQDEGDVPPADADPTEADAEAAGPATDETDGFDDDIPF